MGVNKELNDNCESVFFLSVHAIHTWHRVSQMRLEAHAPGRLQSGPHGSFSTEAASFHTLGQGSDPQAELRTGWSLGLACHSADGPARLLTLGESPSLSLAR